MHQHTPEQPVLPVRGRILAVPPGLPFAQVLAAHILTQHTDPANPLALADVTVWLPTQRAVKALREAFVTTSGDGLVMPRLRALRLGEGESEPLMFEQEIDPTPTMPELARLLYLMRQVQAKDSRMNVSQALDSTQSLAALFDRLMQYDVPFEALTALVPPDMASHWEQNLLFLRIVFEFYPAWLAENGKADASAKRRKLLDIQADIYRRTGVDKPTYAAGFADTTPAGRVVLQSILAGEKGTLVLPSVDGQTLRLAGQPLPASHPHAATFGLMDSLGITPEQVEVIGITPARAALWQQALCPPQGVGTWREALPVGATSGLHLVEAPNIRTEADVIAHLMREVLEEPGKTCALVTPSRGLGQRVADRLRGWGVHVNDSAGVPLRQCPAGGFFALLAQVVAGRFRPLDVAMLTRHPFAHFGMTKKDWRKRAGALEMLVLRGPRPAAGLDGLTRRLHEARKEQMDRPNANHAWIQAQADLALEALDGLKRVCAPLDAVRGDAPLGVWVEAHVQAAKAASLRADGTGGDMFLREADGDALATLLDDWRRTDSHGLTFKAPDYAGWVETVFDRTAVRLRYKQHPRLFIWGSPESRLQAVDRVIIGGCNEGGWPRTPKPDPWLNREMLSQLGLPDPEGQIGLNAQDFLHLACQPEVYLTRAVKEDGAEAVPSRYWAKLHARLQAADVTAYAKLLEKGNHWVRSIDRLHRSALPPKTLPAEVMPEVADLPPTWSASTVRDLMQCPYRTYAGKILGLEALPAFEEAPDAAERGTLLHLCLHAFFEPQDGLPPPFGQDVTHANKAAAEEHLLTIGEAAFARVASPTIRAVWWPRFKRMAAEFVEVQAEHTAAGRTPAHFEVSHDSRLDVATKLYARADRIDHTSAGLVVMDYKTGGIPSKGDVRQGLEPQLTLELLLLQDAGQTPAGAEYWQLAGSGTGFGLVSSPSIAVDEVPELVAEARDGLKRLKAHFTDDRHPMQAMPAGNSPLKPEGLCTYCDFAGICRFKEWQS